MSLGCKKNVELALGTMSKRGGTPPGPPTMAVLQKRTHSKLYPVCAPACRSDSRFPGSMYAMHTSAPGLQREGG